MAQQGLERIPYAVGPDFRMEPVRARFPEQGGSAVSLVPDSFIPDAVPEPKPVASEDPGYTGDIWRGLKYGAQVQLPKMAGQALQFFGADGLGKSMVDAAEARATPDMQESAAGQAEKSPYSVRGNVYEAATNAVPSLAPGAAGAAAGAAVGSVVPGVGTALGALAGYALGSVAALPMFYGSQAKESYDAVKANQLQQGKSESEADAIARRTAHAEGAIEAGGELVADVIPFAKLFKPFAKPVGNAIVKSALVPTVKGAVKTVGGVVAAEVGTEMAQLAGQNAVRKSMGGTGPGATWEETQKVIMPTALMSVIPGMAGAGAKHVQQSAALRALVSPDTDPETRSKIALGAAEAIKAGSPEVSKAFAAYAAEQIAARAPIEIADDAFYASAAGPQPIEGTFIPADRGGPPVATQDPGGDTFTQDREPPQFARPALPAPSPLDGDVLGPEALPAGQAMLPPGSIDSTATEIKDAAPAPTLRQQATSRGLLNHSARPSPDMLKRLMRVDDGMAQRLYDEWAAAQVGPQQKISPTDGGQDGQGQETAQVLSGADETAKQQAAGETRMEQGSAEESIRSVFEALPSVSLGVAYPITVEFNGRKQQFMARQDKLKGRNDRAAIHLVHLKRGRMIAGAPEQWIAQEYKLDSKNRLAPNGMPKPLSDEEAQQFQANFPQAIPITKPFQAVTDALGAEQPSAVGGDKFADIDAADEATRQDMLQFVAARVTDDNDLSAILDRIPDPMQSEPYVGNASRIAWAVLNNKSASQRTKERAQKIYSDATRPTSSPPEFSTGKTDHDRGMEKLAADWAEQDREEAKKLTNPAPEVDKAKPADDLSAMFDDVLAEEIKHKSPQEKTPQTGHKSGLNLTPTKNPSAASETPVKAGAQQPVQPAVSVEQNAKSETQAALPSTGDTQATATIAGKPVSEMTEDKLRNIARGLSPTYGEAAVDKAKAELRRRSAIPIAPQASAERFEIGRALTKEQRKSVIKTLVDVYKANDAPREFKGQDRNGNERYGYAHSPEFFVKSDITGAMVRYYVTLPDGRIAHPTELFPEYSQSDIDGELERQKIEERNKKSDDEFRLKTLNSRKSSDLNEANRLFWKQNPTLAAQSLEYVPALLTNGNEFIRTDSAHVDRDLELLGDGWREKKPGSNAAKTDKESSVYHPSTLRPIEKIDAAAYNGTKDVSSRAGQMELAGRASRIASLKLMNEQLRKIAPDEAWADSNIENATNLDELQDSISKALVDAQRSTPQVDSLRKRLEELSGQELRAVFDAMNLAGSRMTAAERVDALMFEDRAEVMAALEKVSDGGTAPAASIADESFLAKPEELDADKIKAGYAHRSHSLSGKVEMERKWYVDAIQTFYDSLLPLARNDAQKAKLEQLTRAFRDEYRDRRYRVLDIGSSTYSAAIAGPSNFNSKQSERRFSSLDKAEKAFNDWASTQDEVAKPAILALRTADEKAGDDKAAEAARVKKLVRQVLEDLAMIGAIDTGEAPGMSRTAFVNGAQRKIANLSDAGETEALRKVFAQVAQWDVSHEKPLFAAKNSVWQYKPAEEPTAVESPATTQPPSPADRAKEDAQEQDKSEGDAGAPRESRAAQDSTGTAGRLAITQAKSIVAKFLDVFKRAADLDIRIVASPEEIPARFRPSRYAEGVYHSDIGTIWLVTDNLMRGGRLNALRVFQVLLHEAVGHYGLAAMMGDKFKSLKARVLATAKAKGPVVDDYYKPGDADYATVEAVRLRYPFGEFKRKKVADAEVANRPIPSDSALREEYDSLTAAEVLARMAETDPGRTLFGYVRAVVRQWLRDVARKIGIPWETTVAELNDLVALASGYMRRGAGVTAGQRDSGVVAASRKGGAGKAAYKAVDTNSPEFKRWFGDSKVVDAEGKPLVVYHGAVTDDHEGISEFYSYSHFGTWAQAQSAQEDSRLRRGKNTLKKPVITSTVPVYLAIKNPKRVDDVETNARWLGEIRKALNDGYDGIVYSNEYEGVGDSYIAFRPEQIKSAISNTGEFSDSPNILESRARPGANEAIWDAPDPTTADNVIYTLQDKHIDLKRVQAAIKESIGKELPDQIDPYLQEELFHGRAAKATEEFLDRELQPLIGEMKQRGIGMDSLETYLWARHAGERNAQIAKINPDMPDGGSGLTDKQARDVLAGKDVTVGGQTVKGIEPAKLRGHAELARKIDMMVAGNRLLLELYELETPSTLAAWKGAYQHYVPLHREDVDSPWAGQGTGQGYSVRGASTKRATGSYRPVENILANLVMQRKRIITRGEKNRVAQALYGLATVMENRDFWKVDDVPKIRVPVTPPSIFEVRFHGSLVRELPSYAEAKRFVEYDGNAGLTIHEIKRKERVVEQDDPMFRSRPNVVWARFGGEDRFVIFNERDERAMRLAGALKNLDADDISHFLGEVSRWTRYFASINTQYNPVFGVVNLTRDTGTGLINLQSTPLKGKQAEMLGHVWQALPAIYRAIRIDREGGTPTGTWAELWEEFQEVGGQTGYRDMFRNATEQRDALEAALDPKWWQGKLWGKALTLGGVLAVPEQFLIDAKYGGKWIFNLLSDYNTTMENAIRLSAYKVARDQGMSRERAASLAKNLTVNFNRKGQSARQLGALYAFFNASVQGTARMLETLTHGRQPGKVLGRAGKQIVYGGLLLGSMQAMWLAAAGFDDDEPPEFVRDRAIIIPLPDKRYLSVPLPLGFHVLPALGRIGTEQVLNGFKAPGRAAFHVLDVMADAFNPIGNAGMSMQTLAPTVLDPAAALAENKDWTGKQIYRENFSQLDPKPGHQRTKDTATALSKWLSQALNSLTGGTEFQPGGLSPTPDQIDYLIGQVTGGVGREISKLAQTGGTMATGEELPAYKIPLIGRFYGDAKGQAAVSSRFYENLKAMNMHQAEFIGLAKSDRGDQAKAYLEGHPEASMFREADRMQRYVGKLQDEKRKAIADRMPSAKVKEIDAKITEAMQGFNARVAARRAPAVPAQ